MQLRIEVGADPDSDAEELNEATLDLRRELLELDVGQVARPAGDSPPPGARAADAGVLGALLVTATPELVTAVVNTVASWIQRRLNRGVKSVKVEIDGDSIEVTGVSKEEQRRLIEAFLARHGTADRSS